MHTQSLDLFAMRLLHHSGFATAQEASHNKHWQRHGGCRRKNLSPLLQKIESVNYPHRHEML